MEWLVLGTDLPGFVVVEVRKQKIYVGCLHNHIWLHYGVTHYIILMGRGTQVWVFDRLTISYPYLYPWLNPCRSLVAFVQYYYLQCFHRWGGLETLGIQQCWWTVNICWSELMGMKSWENNSTHTWSLAATNCMRQSQKPSIINASGSECSEDFPSCFVCLRFNWSLSCR